MSHLDILIPYGLPAPEMAADLAKELDTPALSMLTARCQADRSGTAHENIERFSHSLPHEFWLTRRFIGNDDWKRTGSPPIAAALMQSFGLPVEEGTWFVLQPVHIHVARDHLVLTDPEQLHLNEQDARVLFSIAQALFEETGRTLLYGSADIWFVRADDWHELRTSTPDAASGHNIDIWMPKGPGERDWRKVQNEVQMHWFDHQINAEREARGLKPVNSIWIWGGAHRAALPSSSDYTDTFNLHGWMRAFAPLVPRHADAMVTAQALAAKPRNGLVALDALLEPALTNDWASWLEHMHTLEAHWFAPLLNALKSGALDSAQCIFTNDTRISRFTTTRSSLRKFWVRPSLAALCR